VTIHPAPAVGLSGPPAPAIAIVRPTAVPSRTFRDSRGVPCRWRAAGLPPPGRPPPRRDDRPPPGDHRGRLCVPRSRSPRPCLPRGSAAAADRRHS
jgi:hypothetical protein